MMNHVIEKIIRKTRPAILTAFLKNIFGISRREAKTVFGISFWIDPVSLFGAELIEKNVYEPQLSHAIKTLLRAGDTFFDIGANEGYFSVLASAVVKNEGKIFLVEPQKRLDPIIRKNLLMNSCKNVQIVSAAFSDNSDGMNLNLSSSINTGSSSFHKRSIFMTKERVSSITLDEYISQNSIKKIRLIKIDCEGAQFMILSGSKNALKNHIAEIISVDYHPQIVGEVVVKKIDALLRASGYLLVETAQGPWFYYLPSFRQDLMLLAPIKEISPL